MTFFSHLRKAAIATAFVLGATAVHAEEQYFPLQSYRVGPYAAGGTGFFGGFIDYAMIDRITDDKVPLITINHGRTDTTDGRVFPYVFPLLLNPYSETSGIVNYIASKEGGLDKLKGKNIVVLYHGSPYG
ncbi:MAG: ABC transporter permease, partial [Mesorhizobium sp.]